VWFKQWFKPVKYFAAEKRFLLVFATSNFYVDRNLPQRKILMLCAFSVKQEQNNAIFYFYVNLWMSLCNIVTVIS